MADIHYPKAGRRNWLKRLTRAERWTLGGYVAAMLATALVMRFFPTAGFVALFILGAAFKPLCYAVLRRIARESTDDSR